MSHPLARRTGTVSAIVAAASVSMVAGCWPALGLAHAEQAAVPGQDKKASPVVEPVVAPVVEPVVEPAVEPVVAPVEDAAVEPVVAPVEDAVVVEPARSGPWRDRKNSAPSTSPGQDKKTAPVAGPVAPVEPAPEQDAGGVPVPGPVAPVEPVKKAPGQDKKDPAPVAGPIVGPTVPVEPVKTAPGQDEKDPAPVDGPVLGPTVPVEPVKKAPGQDKKAPAPVTGPVLGPTVPVEPVKTAPGRPAAAPARPADDRPSYGNSSGADGNGKGDTATGQDRPAPGRPAEPALVGPPTGVPAEDPQGHGQAPHGDGPAQYPHSTPLVDGAASAPPSAPVVPQSGVLSGGLTAAPATLSSGAPRARAMVAAVDPLPASVLGTSRSVQELAPAAAAAALAPAPQPRPLPADLTTALPQLATRTAAGVAETPELPIGIGAVVVVFLLLQSRIDRRDPKLALAPVEDEEPLRFTPSTGGTVGVRVLVAA